MVLNFLTGNALLDLLGIAVALVAVIITYYKWKFTFWEKRGVPTLNPTIPFGDNKKMFYGQITIGEQYKNIYAELKKKKVKHGGVYSLISPEYIPIDPELIKHIMQMDFGHFVNHGSFVDEVNDPLTANLFALEDQQWRNMRVKLTPTFTSGKMKMMFQTLADCTHGLKDIMDDCADNKTPVDIKEILGRFTTDIIGSAAFGLECNSLKDPDAKFRTYGRRIFENSFWDLLKMLATLVFPHSLLRLVRLKTLKPEVTAFFMDVVKKTVDYREQNNIYRKDFMHLLLQLKNRGTVTDDDKISDGTLQEHALTFNELAAQAFVFFVAGFETSSTLMTFTLFELAQNPDVQDKLREEINRVLEKHNNEVTYEAMMEMTYMEKVLHEGLRKYPPIPMLPRVCNKDYKVPGTSTIIPKGMQVRIPILGLQHDEEYYPNPEKFDPDRFTEENKAKRPAYTWLPFGEGPRLCIGLRFGMLQSKVGLTTLLRNYKITLSKKTHLPIEFEKNGFILAVDGGVWLDVKKLTAK